MDISFKKDKCVIGTKQVLRMLDKDKIHMVYIAKDTDTFVFNKITDSCKKNGIQYELIVSKENLGKMAGIEVFAACVGVLK